MNARSGGERPDIGSLIHRCDHLGQEIERFIGERERPAGSWVETSPGTEGRRELQAHANETQTKWAATFSAEALALLRDLREAGLDERYLPESGPHPDPHSAEKWQAASEARDFLRTGWVDEIGMAHLARYFRLAADRLREQQG